MEQEDHGRVSSDADLHPSVVKNMELSQKAKLSSYCSVHILTLSYCHKVQLMSQRYKDTVGNGSTLQGEGLGRLPGDRTENHSAGEAVFTVFFISFLDPILY